MVLFRSIFIGMVLLLFLPQWGAAEGFRPGHISGVGVAPTGKRVVIRCDARPGPYSDFVIGSPNRLVIDFDGAGLLRAPRKIRVGRGGVREIRLGYYGARARVVIDFGANPVPRYELRRGEKSLVVSLSRGAGSRAARKSKKRPKRLSFKRNKPKPQRRAGAAKRKAAAISIKSARVTDGLVVVELADGNNPGKSCRLVLDVDPGRLRVRRAVLSDAKGNLRSFNLSKRGRVGKGSAGIGKGTKGPRRQAEKLAEKEKKFEWGLPSVKAVAPGIRERRKKGPVRPERVQLTERSPARES
jgi:hypothetical protein